jgi:large subunit ribosomal protein L10
MRSNAAVLVDYKGINVAQSDELRKRSREAGVDFVVTKNTLALRAANAAGVEQISEHLSGPTAIAFSQDPVVSAKLMAEFAGRVETFDLKGGLLDDGKLLDSQQVVALSRLPGREQLIAQVVGGIASPLTGLVTALNNTVQGVVVALGQIAEQKRDSEDS